MEANKVFGQAKGQEADKLNIDSIIARLLEGERKFCNSHLLRPENAPRWVGLWSFRSSQALCH